MILNYFLVLAAGLVVGVINGMAGGASIISYPVLLACGLNPIVAVGTNAVGVTAANFTALASVRKTLHSVYVQARVLVLISVISAILGATLLLSMSEALFREIVPFLLLTSTLSLLIPVRAVERLHAVAIERCEIAASGFYCGYFGPGQGVMVLAALARNPGRTPKELNTLKNVVVGTTALASNAIYIATGHVSWIFAGILFIGAAAGGFIGGHSATRMSPTFYRAVVFCVGIAASAWLFASVR